MNQRSKPEGHQGTAKRDRLRLAPAFEPVTIEPTNDADLVRSIVTHPRVYFRMADDFAPAPEALNVPITPFVAYILVRACDCPVGLFVVIQRSPVLCEVHFCFLPESWGRIAREAAKLFLAWLWKETTYQRAIGNIPSSNRLAARFAKEFGFRAFGRNPRSFQKGGKLIDEVWVGISRPPQE